MSNNRLQAVDGRSWLYSSWARMAVGTVVVAAGLMAATSAADALAYGRNDAAEAASGPRDGHGHEHRMGHHRGGPMGGMMGLPLHGRGLDKLLDTVDATDAQRTQIQQIAQAASKDLKALHTQGRELQGKAMALLQQSTIDEAAAEQLRQQMLTQHDAASKRMLTAALDVAKVLTPEQRTKLAAKLKKHQERHASWQEKKPAQQRSE